jgi:hypothetical protein
MYHILSNFNFHLHLELLNEERNMPSNFCSDAGIKTSNTVESKFMII